MGQKVHPVALRLGYTVDWSSRWFARRRDFARLLHEDLKIRQHVRRVLATAGIARVEIERTAERVRVIIWSARPGVVIGRKGADIDRLRDDLQQLTKREIVIDIKEVKDPNLSAQLVAENIALQLEKRIGFRRAMKRAIASSRRAGASGVKVCCAGRLGGSEMSRRETYHEGKVPLHTLRAAIDYGFTEARTLSGQIGVKVWLYHGEATPLRGDRYAQGAQVARGRPAGGLPPVRPSEPASPESGGEPRVGQGAAAAHGPVPSLQPPRPDDAAATVVKE